MDIANMKRKRRQPDVRKIKKHSDIMRAQRGNVVVGGAREKTDTGYVVPGYKGKTFETYFESMLAGSSTATYKHEKKDKTIRIISGDLFVLTKTDGVEKQQRAIAGDEVVLERGTEYRLATSKEDVEFFVVQSAKYNAAIEIVSESSLVARDVSPELLETPTMQHRINRTRPQDVGTRRRGSKAKQQLMAQRGGRKVAQVIDEPIPGRVGAVEPGVSPRPSLGKFSEEDAG
jgi:mannose-6-phosphate isomerase-like protein (cupin superfamily)